jgi:cytochrome c biogenesis protein CcmG/thiol:disulfide interchange protein DsbE
VRLAGLVIALCLAVGALAVALRGDLGTGSPSASPGPSVAIVGGSPLLNRPAPDFTLSDLDGQPVSLSDYRGRPVIVNFWASWCGPCKIEFPIFQDARERYRADGLEILGVVHHDSAEAAAAFVEEEGSEWPALLDPNDVAWSAYSGLALPTSFFIDREGVVRAVSFGPPLSGTLDDQLEKIL